MTRLNTILLTFLVCHLAVPLTADPIEKLAVIKKNPFVKPPELLNIPKEITNDKYVFGDTDSPQVDEDNLEHLGRRDQVCESQANDGCNARCITLEETCFCGTNGKTYRNQCEMSCMRKVDMKMINWLHFGKCSSPCPSDRIQKYKQMVEDMMVTEYLKKNVKRCSKITNCLQAKVVLQYTGIGGRQSISECHEQLPAYLLFTGLLCTGSPVQISKSKSEFNLADYLYHFLLILETNYVTIELQRVFNNEAVINCASAKRVNSRLFNNRNCARANKGPSKTELVQWSFDMLDIDEDRQLAEDELEMLSFIPDQECGESFFTHCDTDMDGYIREDEWSRCLGCSDCYRPCYVFQSEKKKQDRGRRYVQSVVTCNRDGTCSNKQCERIWSRHELCWCVDPRCNEIKGTKSYAAQECN